VHDNNKDKDSHLWPGKGSIDWAETVRMLRSAPRTPPLLLEIEADEKINPIDHMQQTYDKLDSN
jgi:sugar phosphate isomerase/epimerase